MIPDGKKTKRERKLGNSRIDFQIEKNFVEVKMLLINTPSRFDKLKINETKSKFDSFDRLIKHFDELGKEIQKIVSENQNEGSYSVLFSTNENENQLNSGFFFCKSINLQKSSNDLISFIHFDGKIESE
jgi:hypothetical protein